MRTLIMQDGELTLVGQLINPIIQVDLNAHGTLVDLGLLYLVYMGMLAVFCTNAINIYAGINGLEAGQSYIIGCTVLVHNLMEIRSQSLGLENHLFSAMIMLSFVGVTLALLRHNWYPASVFVGVSFLLVGPPRTIFDIVTLLQKITAIWSKSFTCSFSEIYS